MRLQLTIEKMKDKTKKEKQIVSATLFTEIPEMERIDILNELPEDSDLGKELQIFITNMLAAKRIDMLKEKIK